MTEHFSITNGMRHYGRHLLIEVRDGKNLDNATLIEQAFEDAIKACGAKKLNIFVHSFGEGYGITALAGLSESHMSLHSWPETGYAALDIYTCGSSDPNLAIPVFKAAFLTDNITVQEFLRGQEPIAS